MYDNAYRMPRQKKSNSKTACAMTSTEVALMYSRWGINSSCIYPAIVNSWMPNNNKNDKALLGNRYKYSNLVGMHARSLQNNECWITYTVHLSYPEFYEICYYHWLFIIYFAINLNRLENFITIPCLNWNIPINRLDCKL